MNKNTLAIFGGNQTIPYEFNRYNSIGIEEEQAVIKVIKSGVLSKFIGAKHPDFSGGPKVKEFETSWAKYFNVKHAVTVNSWTSGLVAAVGAIGIEPGDEIIVTPWTMCASATAILNWNAIPVFADIDERTYNIDPKSIRKNISKYTKAIMAVDIFGQSADMDEISEIASEYDLRVISDAAQAPHAIYKDKFAGTLADVGGYSLNYHKHIHTGEGGVLVTNSDVIAKKLKLIRNHAETSVDNCLTNMIGQNFRLGEIECAIGIEQLKKLEKLVKIKQNLGNKLTSKIKNLNGLKTPFVKDNRDHVYYGYGLQIDKKKLGISRKVLCDALRAEGVPVSEGYSNLHLLPMYQKKIAYGSNGFPWTSEICKREINYEKGICPVAEKLHDETFFSFGMCVYDLDEKDIDLISKAFKKIWDNLEKLR